VDEIDAHKTTVVPDLDLRHWLESGTDEVRELIVEACVPKRRVSLSRRGHLGSAPMDIRTSAPEERESVLSGLAAFASELLDEPPKTLRAAGALAVCATPKQAKALAEHRLVKTIRPNRRLG